MLELEELAGLVEELRQRGYDIGSQECLNAHRLFLALAAEGRAPHDAVALTTLLAPLFCSTPVEQDDFHAWFSGWLKRQRLIGQQEAVATPNPPAGSEWVQVASSAALRLGCDCACCRGDCGMALLFLGSRYVYGDVGVGVTVGVDADPDTDTDPDTDPATDPDTDTATDPDTDTTTDPATDPFPAAVA